MRRGFKQEANEIAREVRGELRVGATSPLDVHRLARHLDFGVIPLSKLRATEPHAVKHLLSEQSSFSAATVFRERAGTIVHNDGHSSGRQASNIAHELAHGLLLHEPRVAVDDRGCRLWDREMEEEATWLSGALLVSEEAALLVARCRLSTGDAAVRYGVSQSMMIFRLNVTGARKRVDRANRYRQ